MRKLGSVLLSLFTGVCLLAPFSSGKRLSYFKRDNRPIIRAGCVLGHHLKFDPGSIEEIDIQVGKFRIRSEANGHRGTIYINDREIVDAEIDFDKPDDKARLEFFGLSPLTIKLKDSPTLPNLIDVSRLPPHKYADSPINLYLSEWAIITGKTGFIYTRKGGFMDIVHLRNHADIVAFLVEQILEIGPEGGSFIYDDRAMFGGDVKVTFYPPEGHFTLEEYVLPLAQKVSQDLGTWHEVITWFDHIQFPILSERVSAFSVEDNYSNLIGTYVGRDAVLDKERDFEKAMDFHLKEWINFLGGDSYLNTMNALNEVAGKWWDPNIRLAYEEQSLMRDFRIGPDYLEPWIIESRLREGEEPYFAKIPKIPGQHSIEFHITSNKIKEIFGKKPDENLNIMSSEFESIIQERILDQINR